MDLHEHTINKKIEIMVEHFTSQVQGRIKGHAKAMIVTRSRLHAVRYKLAMDEYLRGHGNPFKALVAFSDTVDDCGIKYTETGMNGLSEKQTAETFKQDEYKFLIVAEKFQTGFDQPLLHTMYVDKRLRGLHAVQTLSRLNRVHPDKEESFVLDFANEADDIQKAFQPYYEKTLLSEGTDPNLLYDLETQLRQFHFFDHEQVERFAGIYFDPKGTHSQLHNALSASVEAYLAAGKEDQVNFRELLERFTRLYSFLTQVMPFVDADLEKLYIFCRLLRRRLPVEREKLPLEIQSAIDIESLSIQKRHAGKIKLKRDTAELNPDVIGQPAGLPPTEMEALSQIIKELNQRFGTDFSQEDHIVIRQIEQSLAQSEVLKQTIRVNTPENAMLTFKQLLEDLLQDMLKTNFKFYQKVDSDHDFAEFFTRTLFERYRRSQGLGSV